MAQSWKSIVDEVAGQEPLPIVYRFSQGVAGIGKLSEKHRKKKYPMGVYVERKSHGAYDGDNED